MKVLQLTKKVPFPLKDGESIAVTQLAKGLVSQGCNIHLLSFNSIKHKVNIIKARESMTHYSLFESVPLDNRVKPFPAFFNLFSDTSYNIIRFYSKEFIKYLKILLRKHNYDVIIVESLFMTLYIDTIKEFSEAKIVMRSHNIEFQIWDRLASNEINVFKSWYLRLLTRRLKNYELEMAPKYDLIVTISSNDQKYFEELSITNKIITIPTGVDMKTYKDCKKQLSNPIRFFFLGSLDWAPNIEGLKWFINKVWINKNFNAHLYIAGRNCPEWLFNIDIKDISVKGEIDDAHEFICDNDIMIVPLFSGSGIRIKIIESMAIGKPVISTDIGREGINAMDGEEIIIANNKEEYLKAMKDVVEGNIMSSSISTKGQEFIFQNFNHFNLSRRLYQKLKSL